MVSLERIVMGIIVCFLDGVVDKEFRLVTVKELGSWRG